MPDADDFDVEYFRELLKGNSPQGGPTPLVKPDLPDPKRNKRSTGTQTPPKGKGKSTTGQKKKSCR